MAGGGRGTMALEPDEIRRERMAREIGRTEML